MFVNIGYGNYVNTDEIISVSRFDAAPVRRLVQSAKEEGHVIDATQGRKTKSVILSTNGFLILSALLPDTIAGRTGTHLTGETESASEKEREHL